MEVMAIFVCKAIVFGAKVAKFSQNLLQLRHYDFVGGILPVGKFYYL